MVKKYTICWKIQNCKNDDCPVYKKEKSICWLANNTICYTGDELCLDEKFQKICTTCKVYRTASKKTAHSSLIRLALYLQQIEHLRVEGIRSVSSRSLGTMLGISPTQIRKDFSAFNILSNSKSGYGIKFLVRQLRMKLNMHKKTGAVIIGIGDCAKLLLKQFDSDISHGIFIKRLFSQKKGCSVKTIYGYRVYSPTGLFKYIKKENIKVAIVATTDPDVSTIFDILNQSPIKAICNFAPFNPKISPRIKLFSFNLHISLDTISYYVDHDEIPVLPENSII